MQPDVGKIYEGKVTGITKFGAFVELEPGVTGMVHISEVANTFVNEIRDHLTEGQQVKVKVLAVSEDGKYLYLSKRLFLLSLRRNSEADPTAETVRAVTGDPGRTNSLPRSRRLPSPLLRICSTSSRQAPMSAWAI